MKNRIYSLDVFKFLLAYLVALFHLGLPLSAGAKVAVDTFFILSGFYLARRFCRNPEESAWDYTLSHAKSIYPHYIFALFAFFTYQLIRTVLYLVLDPSWDSLWNLGAYIYDQLPDVFYLNSAYYFPPSLVYPTWQISAMLIAGYFIRELLHQNEAATRKLILPASLLMVQSLLYTGADLFGNFGFFYIPLLRAFSAMGLGVMTWFFMQSKYCSSVYGNKKAVNIISLFALAALVLYVDRGQIYLILVPFLVILLQDPECWINRILNKPAFAFCGKFSLSIYVNHSLLERFVKTQVEPRFDISLPVLALVYTVLLTVYSIFTLWFVETILKRRAAKKAHYS